MYSWLEVAGELLYPGACLLCGASGDSRRDLCQACYSDLPINAPACGRCGLPLESQPEFDTQCGRCQRTPPPFETALIPYLYRPPVDDLIRSLKFEHGFSEGRLLGMLLASVLAPPVFPDAIVPIPLHSRRLRERGFNQSFEIARPVGRALGIPVLSNVIRRVQPTAPQTGFDAEKRKRNVRDAFTVDALHLPPRIALLDDVVTTGATVGEAARALRRAGAREISIWAVARTPP